MSNLINFTQEVWKDIPGYKGYYQISNTGQIKSLTTGKAVKQHIGYGYKRVNLSKNNKHVLRRVHRLFAQAFIPNPDNKPFINHKNMIRHDNRIENLEWVFQFENTRHGYADRKKNRKLSLADLNDIYVLSKSKPLKEISLIYGIPKTALWTILTYIHPDY